MMKTTKKFYCGHIEIAVKYLEFMGGFNRVSARIVVEITQKDSGDFLDSLFVDFDNEDVMNISCIMHSNEYKKCVYPRNIAFQIILGFIRKYAQADYSDAIETVQKYLKRCERIICGIVHSNRRIEKFHFRDSISVIIENLEYDTYTDYSYTNPRLDYFVAGIVVTIAKHLKNTHTRKTKNVLLGHMKIAFDGDNIVYYTKDRGDDSKYHKCKTNEVKEIVSEFISSKVPPEICDGAIKSLVGYIDKCEEVVTV